MEQFFLFYEINYRINARQMAIYHHWPEAFILIEDAVRGAEEECRRVLRNMVQNQLIGTCTCGATNNDHHRLHTGVEVFEIRSLFGTLIPGEELNWSINLSEAGIEALADHFGFNYDGSFGIRIDKDGVTLEGSVVSNGEGTLIAYSRLRSD